MKKVGMLVAVIAALWIAPPTVGAAPHGGSGGSPFNLTCSADEVLVGMNLRTGALVDAVEALCVRVRRDGTWLVGHVARGRAGGSGGGPVTALCQQGYAVTGIHGRAGALVDSVGTQCSPLAGSGSSSTTGPFGGGGGTPFSVDACPRGQVGKGLRGRSGTLVDQIELTCGPSPVQATQAPAQPAGVATTSVVATCDAGYGWHIDIGTPVLVKGVLACSKRLGQCNDRGAFDKDPTGVIGTSYAEPPGGSNVFWWSGSLFTCWVEGGYAERKDMVCPTPPPGVNFSYEIDKDGSTDKCTVNAFGREIIRVDPDCPSGYSTRKIQGGRDFCDRWVRTSDRKKVTTSSGQVDSVSCPKGNCFLLKNTPRYYHNTYTKAQCMTQGHTVRYQNNTVTCWGPDGRTQGQVRLTGQ